MKSTSQSVVSGDFNSNYTVKVTRSSKAFRPRPRTAGGTTTIQARWVGACKPDQRPGDIIMSNGKTMNIRDLRKMMDGKGAPQKK